MAHRETSDVPSLVMQPFCLVEERLADVLASLGSYTAVANDPPWTQLALGLPKPRRVVFAGEMSLTALEAATAIEDHGETIVGIGGGTAMDTAKFIAWKLGRSLIQVPTITSVDAAFTDAIGVRVERKVRYLGKIAPKLVVLDVPLIRSAPPHLNRAGIGDVLSCHTGLYDWRLASQCGQGHPWHEELARLGRELLQQTEAAIADIAAVSEDGVRFLANAYRRIGAACASAGHSRFEEGSEHFWAYAYEAATGAQHIHGELIACGVVSMAVIQDNSPDWVAGMVAKSGVRAHPIDLGIRKVDYLDTVKGLATYARAENLDVSVADLRPIRDAQAEAAWSVVCSLPRRDVEK